MTLSGRWLTRARRSLAAFLRPSRPVRPQVLVVVEGPNDIEFLRRISIILHRENSRTPDLADMERRGMLVFVPAGGVDLSTAYRFANLGLPEFHLLDRDVPPATQVREQIAAMVNSRPRCRAAVMSKRSLENYLHPASIFEASGYAMEFSDDDDVPDLVARKANEFHEPPVCWNDLPARVRKRLRYKAKRWLNNRAVEHMTHERLSERDLDAEVLEWLVTIARFGRL